MRRRLTQLASSAVRATESWAAWLRKEREQSGWEPKKAVMPAAKTVKVLWEETQTEFVRLVARPACPVFSAEAARNAPAVRWSFARSRHLAAVLLVN